MDEPTCSHEDCKKPVKARDMCDAHWMQWRRELKKAGLPLPPPEPKPRPVCKADGCGEEAGRRSGYCPEHYQRYWRTGDPLAPDGRKVPKRSPQDRLWVKTDKNGPLPEQRPELGPCHVWHGGTQGSGYGTFYLDGRHIGAHVAAYILSGKPVPEGSELDHLCHPGDGSCLRATCRHRLCVNPDHLEPVTRRENMRRGNTFVAANLAKTHCLRGHELTPENTYVKVLPDGRESRQCHECRRLRGSFKGEPGAPVVPNDAKTHCPKGHPYDEENTYLSPQGSRMCRICRRDQWRAWKERTEAGNVQRSANSNT